MNKHDSKINLIMSFLTAFISFAIFLNFLGYIYTREDRHSVVLGQIEKEKNNFQNLDSSKIEYKKYLDGVNTFLDSYLIGSDNKNFINYINSLDLEVKSDFEIGNIKDDLLDSSSVVFSILIKGEMEDVLKSIGLIENSPYLISIESLNLKEVENYWVADLFLKVRKNYD
jgi:hypothetical protein